MNTLILLNIFNYNIYYLGSTYLGSTITSNILNVEINKRIAMSSHVKTIQEGEQLTQNTMVRVYQAFALSTRLSTPPHTLALRLPKDNLYGEQASCEDVSAVPLCGSRMLAIEILNLLRSALSSGNLLQQNATTADRLCRVVSGRQKKSETNCGREKREKSHRLPRLYIKVSAPVPSVIENQKPDFLVTADAVRNTDITCGTAPLS